MYCIANLYTSYGRSTFQLCNLIKFTFSRFPEDCCSILQHETQCKSNLCENFYVIVYNIYIPDVYEGREGSDSCRDTVRKSILSLHALPNILQVIKFVIIPLIPKLFLKVTLSVCMLSIVTEKSIHGSILSLYVFPIICKSIFFVNLLVKFSLTSKMFL